MKEVIKGRKILDVLEAVSVNRETARYENEQDISVREENEFRRVAKRARSIGYSEKDILKVDLLGRIYACIESGDTVMESFYRNCLEDIK